MGNYQERQHFHYESPRKTKGEGVVHHQTVPHKMLKGILQAEAKLVKLKYTEV